MTPSQTRRRALTLVALVALVACNREAPGPAPPPSAPQAAPAVVDARVVGVELGRSLTPEQTIGDRTDSFLPSDTVYLTVRTAGTAESAVLQARWSGPDGEVIEDTRQTVVPTEAGALSEFHVTRPEGWSSGSYKVEILLEGKPAEVRTFRVS